MAVSTNSGYAIGVLGPFIITDLGINRTQLGAMSTAIFVVGGLLSPAVGRSVDRLGSRTSAVLLFAAGLLGSVGTLVAPGLWWLLVTMAITGIAMAFGNPTTNLVIAESVAPARQGIATGIKQAGVQLGAFAIGIGLPPLAILVGWRVAWQTLTIVAALGVASALRWLPKVEGAPTKGRQRGRLDESIPWLAVYAVTMGMGVSSATTYLPLFATERLSLTEQSAGQVAAVIGLTGIVARLTWGYIGDRITATALPLMVLAFFATVAQVLILLSESFGPVWLWLGAMLLGASAIAWNAIGMLTIVRRVPRSGQGRASGIVLFGFYGGLMIAPVIFGAWIDATGSYTSAWGALAVLYFAGGILMGVWRLRTPRPGSEMVEPGVAAPG